MSDKKYLIVGLGNPGAGYADTRHNVGFQLLDYLVEKVGGEWHTDRFGWRCDIKVKGKSLTLLKPDTYMNLSGKAVAFWMQKIKIQPEQVMAVLDDINIPFGTIRMRKDGSSGGHNGLKSIEESIMSKNYPRLRIGVGSDFAKGRQADFVLSPWTKEEKKLLAPLLLKGAEGIIQFSLAGIEIAMNEVNKKVKEG
ncbi:MAG: aminoacyl-tRNA hydrolase [Saprospiraceae bacterium]|jgi:PTH1 family peptidyl-tRNA hydrolase|nr:aminoacyl-tRNA hydrolase [Saprospiraceae bacterium]MBK6477118.1 aminoacyl-tRNA hydrolase [Saprospiraceae bacterium]MBK6814582.1 aminoacyl-tRNA hydrolase [Saprospiraceae bacterium]MBK7369968.1 aminoacyl-tRNA hydrolase [Saprospiraceae bacterium]MBK8279044.1 aminoacyl-tRNA hydrolase [Saprospiraceae bacterium]